ncbi:MAG TPA: hypothetical protein VIE14_09625, partial [Steroidobacteraceae bacterium]
GGAAVGGMANTQGPSTPPSWLSYVHVADSNRAVAAVKTAGGRLLHGPIEVPGGSWIALFLDPQGGAFAVHELPRTATAVKSAAPAVKGATPKPGAAPAAVAKKTAAKTASPKKAARKKAAKKVARKAAPEKKAARKKVARGKVARKPAGRAAKKKAARRSTRRPARKRSVRRRRR